MISGLLRPLGILVAVALLSLAGCATYKPMSLDTIPDLSGIDTEGPGAGLSRCHHSRARQWRQGRLDLLDSAPQQRRVSEIAGAHPRHREAGEPEQWALPP